ncbi:hypothetical protein NDA11_006312 [Ustilago hordei]|uniref:Uncharacterized protein n=1 Tax=Ustilago hordei TaxID=120017 RepID=I2FU93_USTHO|nr:uncharacterized protein UHO2_04897 [Ustilago hordei]KAJ1573149.1 hypothetical protein NDA12_007276 [Ustilago hordei]KAJ1577620.1 hypothetical protein NDA11_006312 [Ustilago hordei]KAJ1582184.1 hypothetical protein NDA15_004648 [Ustilago hordei]KAJ1597700.1 hypothetical protein NDA14_001361 [Ustilago hordei]CCF50486.1 uncharacterized protein UHOR_14459 [Ustilago hordei]
MRCEIRAGAKIKIRKSRVETPAWHDAGGDDGVAGEEQGGGNGGNGDDGDDGDDGGDGGDGLTTRLMISHGNEKLTKPKRSGSVLTRFAALDPSFAGRCC